MDHVYLPSRPRLKPLDFPLLCSLDEIHKIDDWQSFPQNHGYKVTGEISDDFEVLETTEDGIKNITEDDDTIPLASFFQQWLWFGVLGEFHNHVDFKEFVHIRADDTQWLSTVTLQKHSQELIANAKEQPWASNPDDVQSWGSRRWHVIRRTRTVVFRYLQTYQCSPSDTMSMTILSIALLCEHLHDMLVRVYHQTTPDDPYTAIPQFNWRDEDSDCAMAIVGILKEQGWCPNTLAGLGMYSSRLETLWYYANLEPPRKNVTHENCSDEVCVHLQIDHATYRTKHLKEDCTCEIVGPDPVALADVVVDGKLPLTRAISGTTDTIELVDVQPRNDDTKFIAISHVWADGHGNPDGNLLPTCFLQELQAAVDEVGKDHSTLFWMDTLSIPREPRSVRKLALKKLRDPYDYAAHVLVLDAYLQTQTSHDCSIVELLALINVSSWGQRLWTFQEGRLAKDIWFQFADGKVRISDSAAAREALRSKILSEAPGDIIAFHSSTNILNSFWPGYSDGVFPLTILREGVRLRSTSVATDEALCLGSIAGLDMSKILDQPEELRMNAFWRMVKNVNVSMGMSKSSRKLEEKGLRWAPASLMGDIGNNDWDGPRNSTDMPATISPDGLICDFCQMKFLWKTLPGFERNLQALYNIAMDEAHEVHELCHGIKIQTLEGKWLACNFEEAWHQTPHPVPTGGMPAILLEDPIYLLQGTEPTETTAGDNIAALFVSYVPSADGTSKQTFPIRHCSLYRLADLQCVWLEEIDTAANQILGEHSDAVANSQGSWEAIYELVAPLIPELFLGTDRMDIGRRAISLVRGTDEFDDQVILNNAIVLVTQFCYVGPYTYVDEMIERESWIID